MILRELEVTNYRSLKQVTLSDLELFNVLIGRNNVGKSNVFRALRMLGESIEKGTVDVEQVLTDQDPALRLKMRLRFELTTQERSAFITTLTDTNPGRRVELLSSSLATQVEYTFETSPVGEPSSAFVVFLALIKIQAESEAGGNLTMLTPIYRSTYLGGDSEMVDTAFTKIADFTERARTILMGRALEVSSTSTYRGELQQHLGLAEYEYDRFDPGIRWLMQNLRRFFRNCYYLDPFRHSANFMPSKETNVLSNDGLNLAQRPNSIHNSDGRLFAQIEQFVHQALPDIGSLETPLKEHNTEVAFRPQSYGHKVKLHDLGGGVEQLLLLATLLLAESESTTLFVEEPESHMHPGAQRYLIDRIRASSRQVFITSHSPVFANIEPPCRIYQVSLVDGYTRIDKVALDQELSALLDDIGSRNSDVLMSDGLLFVEGPGDQRVFDILAHTLKMPFTLHNITVALMGGGERIDRRSKARLGVLKEISRKAIIPTLFVVDRDERSKAEMRDVNENLSNVHVLARREIENYFLIPQLLRRAMEQKYAKELSMLKKLEETSDEDILDRINKRAEELYTHVLLRRIRSELGSIDDILVRPDLPFYELEYSNNLHTTLGTRKLAASLRGRIRSQLQSKNIENIILTLRSELDNDWNSPDKRLNIAPGEELVNAAFALIGGKYSKKVTDSSQSDTELLAKLMQPDEIAPELVNIIERIHKLTAQAK